MAGFVLGLLGFLGAFIPILNIGGLILGLIGAILAAAGLAKAKKVGAGKGLAIAGLVLGLLAVVIAIIINIAFVGAVDDAAEDVSGTDVQAPAGANTDQDSESEQGELGATRANPAPIGSAITGGDWTVTVNSVNLVEADSLGQPAEAGKVLLAVNLTATYNGDDEQGETAWASIDFVATDGTSIDTTSGSSLFIPENGFDSLATVYNGGTVTGDTLLEVPAEDWESGVLAVSPALFSDKTFVALN